MKCEYQLLSVVAFQSSAPSRPGPDIAHKETPEERLSSQKPQQSWPEDQKQGPTGLPLNPDYSKRDFELLHHYSTDAYRSFASTSALENVWSVTVPQEAFLHDFLLHGILALSAFHLSYLRPLQKTHYAVLANHHYPLSIAAFRKKLEDGGSNSGDALLAYSIVAVVNTFAVSCISKQQEHSAIDQLMTVAALQRGVVAIVGEFGNSHEEGIIAPMVSAWRSLPTIATLPGGIEHALQRLEAHCKDMLQHNELQHDYVAAIADLRRSFQHALGTENRLMALEWFINISENFVSACKSRKGMAVVVMAHFGVLLHYMRDFWWIGDFGRRIVEEALRISGNDWDWAHWADNEVCSN